MVPVLILLIGVCLSSADEYSVQPSQVHLSYGTNPQEMVVTWVTTNTTMSVVEFSEGEQIKFTYFTKGSSRLFVDGGSEHRSMYMHKVVLAGLQQGQKYVYHCGSPDGWSSIFFFTAMKAGSNWSPTFAVFGDMGYTNAKTVPFLQEAAQLGTIDAVLHNGDFAYDMDSDNARVGDTFMQNIESVAAYIPYMTCAGNHENAYNFSNYRYRFNMPGGDGEGIYYSFNMGPAHIIGFSTEVYYYGKHETIFNQLKWLEEDLKEANDPKNRAERPWIVVMGHKPMYCSNNDKPNEICNNEDKNPIIHGLPNIKAAGVEQLFYKYGVDLQFYAHEHSFERLWPVYNKTVCNGTTTSNPYTNPRAPVHIVTGSGGNGEGQTGWDPIVKPWSAFHSDDYGYTKMTIHNKTHLSLAQISADKGGKVLDEAIIIREKHGAGQYDCHLQNNS